MRSCLLVLFPGFKNLLVGPEQPALFVDHELDIPVVLRRIRWIVPFPRILVDVIFTAGEDGDAGLGVE